MKTKLFDVYGIIGLLVSITAVIFTMYKPPETTKLIYVGVIIVALIILAIVIILLNKFKEINQKTKEINIQVNENKNKINDLNKRFKTLEDLNNIRLDIRELKSKVFKNE